jgi:hypothetical protein
MIYFIIIYNHILCFCKEKIGTRVEEFDNFVHYNEHLSHYWRHEPGSDLWQEALDSIDLNRLRNDRREELKTPSLERVGVGYFRITFDVF